MFIVQNVLSSKHIDAVLETYEALLEKRDLPTDKFVPCNALCRAFSKIDGPIVLLRHGATEMSEQGLLTGGASFTDLFGLGAKPFDSIPQNISLSEAGKRETLAFAASASGEHLRAFAARSSVFVSPSKRTVYTANAVLKEAAFRTCWYLIERNLGRDSGNPAKEGRLLMADRTYHPAGGEGSNAHVQRVVATFIENLHEAKAAGKKSLLYIGHSGEIGVKLASVLALTGGLVEQGSWNGTVEPYTPLEISKPIHGKRIIRAFAPGE